MRWHLMFGNLALFAGVWPLISCGTAVPQTTPEVELIVGGQSDTDVATSRLLVFATHSAPGMQDPEPSKDPVDSIDQAIDSGDYERALALARKLAERKPDDIRTQLLVGDLSFFAGQMEGSIAAYDRAIELNPVLAPQLWQRGLALYYAKQYEAGQRQFETHQTVNSQDVENAVWHLLCASKVSGLETARKRLIPIQRDRRVPMAEVYELFAGRTKPENVIQAAQTPSSAVPADSPEYKLRTYYAHLYIGLFHDMMGDSKASIESMRQAVRICPISKRELMGQVAQVHLKLRLASEKGEQ